MWSRLMRQIERTFDSRYHHGLGMTPLEAFYGDLQVHRGLVERRRQQLRTRNVGKREPGRGIIYREGAMVLVYEYDKQRVRMFRKTSS